MSAFPCGELGPNGRICTLPTGHRSVHTAQTSPDRVIATWPKISPRGDVAARALGEQHPSIQPAKTKPSEALVREAYDWAKSAGAWSPTYELFADYVRRHAWDEARCRSAIASWRRQLTGILRTAGS